MKRGHAKNNLGTFDPASHAPQFTSRNYYVYVSVSTCIFKILTKISHYIAALDYTSTSVCVM